MAGARREREEVRVGTGLGQVMQDRFGAIIPREVGAGGLWEDEGRGLTRGLTGALVADMGRTDWAARMGRRGSRVGQLPWSKVPMMELDQRI